MRNARRSADKHAVFAAGERGATAFQCLHGLGRTPAECRDSSFGDSDVTRAAGPPASPKGSPVALAARRGCRGRWVGVRHLASGSTHSAPVSACATNQNRLGREALGC